MTRRPLVFDGDNLSLGDANLCFTYFADVHLLENMFKGFKGLQKVVKGGISAVAETSKDLSEKVISDPTTSQGHLKENLKSRVTDLVATGQDFAEESHAKDKVEKVEKLASKVKHYGAFGESYLGYEDPNKDLRKAVKAKEKAAKKARKEKKKKKGKTEDLFDPENLAKFKAELEERKKREAEFAAAQEAAASDSDQEDKEKTAVDASKAEDKESDKESDKGSIKFTLDLSAPLNKSGNNSGQSSNAHTPTNKLPTPLTPAKAKEETEDWKKFLDLTSGIDSIIKQKKDELEEIKVDSYFQQKKSTDSEKPVAQDPRSLAALADKKKTKKWVDLDKEGFDDIEGSCSESDEDAELDNNEEKAEDKPEDEEEDKEEDIGLVEIPEDDPIDLDEEEDLFNTAHVDAVISGDIKLGKCKLGMNFESATQLKLISLIISSCYTR